MTRRSVVIKVKKGKRATVRRPAEREMTRLGKALRALGGLGGSAFGGLVGQPVAGGAIGKQLGAEVSRWLGSGDYEVNRNSIVKSTQGIPSMHQTDEGITIRHREFIGVITGKQNFTVQTNFALNPGLSQTFPWLAQIASKFQEYRVLGAVFHYVPSSGAAISSTNAALGTVMMSTNYRATSTAPTDRVTMLNQYWSSESVPSEAFIHPLECARFTSPTDVLFTRTTDLPSADNKMLYDFGVTTLAVGGQQADDTVLGDLWLTYEIQLMKPQISSNVDASGLWCNYYTTTGTYANLFGSMSKLSGSTLPLTFSTNTAIIPAGNPGTYYIDLSVYGTTLTPTAAVSVTPVNCVLSRALGPYASGHASSADSSIDSIAVYTVDPTKPSSIAFAFAGTGGTVTAVYLTVTQRSNLAFA